MIWEYCRRGLLAGLVAGGAYGLFVAAIGNPLVDHVEGLAGHGHEGAGAVGEATAAAVSVGGGVLWGLLLGALFGVAYFLFEPAVPGSRAAKPYVLAAAGFLSVSVVPWLVLPPGVPGVEQSLPAETRLLLYAVLVVAGALLAALAVVLYGRAAPRSRGLAAAVGLAPVILAVLVVPAATPTLVATGDVPTDVVVAFRGLVALGQAGLWLLIAASFDWLARRGRREPAAGGTGDADGSNV